MDLAINPIVRIPFLGSRTTMQNFQNHPDCWKRELALADCLEAYGPQHAHTKCGIIMSDFRECVLKSKRRERITIMRNERRRQVADGERDPNNMWAKSPIMDTW